jgi:hypothetical protein
LAVSFEEGAVHDANIQLTELIFQAATTVRNWHRFVMTGLAEAAMHEVVVALSMETAHQSRWAADLKYHFGFEVGFVSMTYRLSSETKDQFAYSFGMASH